MSNDPNLPTTSKQLIFQINPALGFSFVQRVPRSELSEFIAAEQAAGMPDFSVFPSESGDRPDLYVTRYIEPFQNNRQAVGFDIASDPVRREAAENAMLTGRPLSGKSTLVQDQKHRVGFLYLMPVYRKGSTPTTPEDRKRDLIGWISVPVVVEGDGRCHKIEEGLLHVEIYDGPQSIPDVLLYSEISGRTATEPSNLASRHFTNHSTINIGGHDWTLRVGSNASFDAMHDSTSTLLAAGCGTLISILIALQVRGLAVSCALRCGTGTQDDL